MKIEFSDLVQIVVALIGFAGVVYSVRQQKKEIDRKDKPRASTIVMCASVVLLVANLAVFGWRYWGPNAKLSGEKPAVVVRPSEFEQELSKANIILSEVDRDQVRMWLRNDTAYQALAQLCLTVLKGKRVVDPVPLDVINGYYKQELDYAFDEWVGPEEYNDRDKLEIAIFRTWKERYKADPRSSFDEIVESISKTP